VNLISPNDSSRPRDQYRSSALLYALDTVLEGLNKPTKAQVESAMKGHVLVQAELLGTYQKGQ